LTKHPVILVTKLVQTILLHKSLSFHRFIHTERSDGAFRKLPIFVCYAEGNGLNFVKPI